MVMKEGGREMNWGEMYERVAVVDSMNVMNEI